MCRQVTVETIQFIENGFEFRNILKFVAADHNIYGDAIVKAQAVDERGRIFFVNMFNDRALRASDLDGDNFETMFEDLVRRMTNSGCTIKFGIGTQIKIQFFLVGGNGVRHENALQLLDEFNHLFPNDNK